MHNSTFPYFYLIANILLPKTNSATATIRLKLHVEFTVVLQFDYILYAFIFLIHPMCLTNLASKCCNKRIL